MKNFQNVFTVIAILVIGLTSYGNHELQEEAQSPPKFILKGGQFITPELAQTHHFITENLFGEERILDLLNQDEAEGLRIYQSNKGLVLVATDAQGNDLTDLFLGFGLEKVGGISMLLESDVIPVASL